MTNTYLGVFSARRSDGHRLHDGNAAALRVNDKTGSRLVAVGEERLSRAKHGDGFERAARYCLGGVGYTPSDQLHVGFASSLDSPWTEEAARVEVERLLGLLPDSVTVVRHHDSHALSAFVGSAFAEALVIVVDGEGNSLGDVVETSTVYLAKKVGQDASVSLDVLARDHVDGRGVGQLYRGATKFLGFPSYHDSSKVMALAGVGRAQGISPFESNDAPTTLGSALMADLEPNDITASFAAGVRKIHGSVSPPATSWFHHNTYDILPPLDRAQLSVAVGVQCIVEEEFLRLAATWVHRTGLRNLCLSGGVAMNCVAAARLRELGIEVFVPSAPSDEGQGLGALLAAVNRIEPFALPPHHPAWLGAPQRLTSLTEEDSDALIRDLVGGRIIARHSGESEYGPRALGHRSLLASSRSASLDTLRRVKHREVFQPFGAIVTAELAASLGIQDSPNMSFAPRLQSAALEWLRPIVHADETCRIQTLASTDDPELHNVISVIEQAGAGPVVNTSLNLRGCPLTETPAQTLELLAARPGVAAGYVNGRRVQLKG